MEARQNDLKEDNWWLRNLIAIIITTLVVGTTVFIAVYMILFNHQTTDSGKFDMSFIGQTLLPLWGTWLGTVLAFYFGKANFEAASKAIKNQTPESKMAELITKDVMTTLKDIKYLDYDTQKTNTLESILADKDFEPYNRFAVFDSNKVVKAMIHRGTFYEFMYKNKSEESSSGNQGLVLKDLLESTDENIKNTLSFGFGFVKSEATVLDAKKLIDTIAECQDVFITQNGNRNEPVLGLLTNNKILELSKV